MSTQIVTLELPESLYQSAAQVAEATQRSVADIVQESLAHTLPPLDDVSPAEATELARLSTLDDAALWQVGNSTMPADEQTTLEQLLVRQSEGALSANEERHLQILLDEYGRLLVRKAHAWLLLARRGYRVPPQDTPA